MSHFHLYMDESGRFETENDISRNPLLFGMLVPDQSIERLTRQYESLKKKFRLPQFVHGRDLFRRPEYKNFLAELVGVTLASDVMLVAMQFERDIFHSLEKEMRESYAANRYLNMAQELIEHATVIHPGFWGSDITFSYHPNSRIIPVEAGNVQAFESFKVLGFSSKQRHDGSHTIFVWNQDALRSYIHRMLLEYSPCMSRIGKRRVGLIETPVAERSEDPFVHWTDNLAGVVAGYQGLQLAQRLRSKLVIDLRYGAEQAEFKALCKSYLEGDVYTFFVRSLESRESFSGGYYGRQFENLAIEGPSSLVDLDMDAVARLQALAEQNLALSHGNWKFVASLLDRLIAVMRKARTIRHDPEADRLHFNLLSNRLSIHNHRGEIVSALPLAMEAEQLQGGSLSFDDWRRKMEFANRQAIIRSNLFDFSRAVESLRPQLRLLEVIRRQIAEIGKEHVRDDLYGKILGTIGLNLAFLAPRQPGLFEEAEEIFLLARDEFSQPHHRFRHEINLMHLYLDWGRSEKIASQLDRLVRHPAAAAFLEDPSVETARGMGFFLHAYLKANQCRIESWDGILRMFTSKRLRELFGEAVDEHPFELVKTYLGCMALRKGLGEEAGRLLAEAVRPGRVDVLREQPTLQVLRAQSLVRWAREVGTKDQGVARTKISHALSILEEVGHNPMLGPILSIRDGAETGGWFAAGYAALKASAAEYDTQACEIFLSEFTFNYC